MFGMKAKAAILMPPLVVCLAAWAPGQEVSEEELRAMVDESVEKALSQKVSLLSRVEIHGFLSQGFLWTDENNYHAQTEDGSFEFNEFGINFSANLAPNLRAGLQLFARDLGTSGNDEITLDWALIDYRLKDWLGLRAGRIRVVEGLYNETREYDMLRTPVFLPESVYAELWRDVFSTTTGASVYGIIPLGAIGELSYEAQYGKLDTDSDSGYARAIQLGFQLYDPLARVLDLTSDTAFTYAVRWQTPVPGLRLGWTERNLNGLRAESVSSGAVIFPPAFLYVYDTFDGFVASAEFVWKDLTLAAEYRETSYIGHVQGNPPGAETTNEGSYFSVAYRLSDLFAVGYYYSEYYPYANDKDGSERVYTPAFYAWTKNHVVSTRFDLKPGWLFKLEAHFVDGWGNYTFAENETVEQNWMMIAAKTTVSF